MSDIDSEARTVQILPVGQVLNSLKTPRDDHWKDFESIIELAPRFSEETIRGLEAFSHLEIIFHFHLVQPDAICSDARHPRNRKEWPKVGIFAQRGKRRPNRLGVSRCRLERVDGRRLHVSDLDAINGTPVIDIKPYMRENAPIGETYQPTWSEELMSAYYSSPAV